MESNPTVSTVFLPITNDSAVSLSGPCSFSFNPYFSLTAERKSTPKFALFGRMKDPPVGCLEGKWQQFLKSGFKTSYSRNRRFQVICSWIKKNARVLTDVLDIDQIRVDLFPIWSWNSWEELQIFLKFHFSCHICILQSGPAVVKHNKFILYKVVMFCEILESELAHTSSLLHSKGSLKMVKVSWQGCVWLFHTLQTSQTFGASSRAAALCSVWRLPGFQLSVGGGWFLVPLWKLPKCFVLPGCDTFSLRCWIRLRQLQLLFLFRNLHLACTGTPRDSPTSEAFHSLLNDPHDYLTTMPWKATMQL